MGVGGRTRSAAPAHEGAVDKVETLLAALRFIRLCASSVVSPGRAVTCLVLLRPQEGPLGPTRLRLRKTRLLPLGAAARASLRYAPS